MGWQNGWQTWANAGLAGLFPAQTSGFARIERISGIERLAATAPLDPARWFEHPNPLPRPDPTRITSDEVSHFQRLLALDTVHDSRPPDTCTTTTPPTGITNLTPAEHIQATLQHLRGLRGL